jgi:hypothetical protein
MADPIANLLQQAEPLASLSIAHLTPASRRMLAQGELSDHSYPNDYGGFVYVGVHGDQLPEEADLLVIVEIARRAELIWLKFDADAAVIDGLPVFDDDG